MRVIAGSQKGRTLIAPRGLATRPTPGRVREALFSMLGDEVQGARVLDLFAGTGSLGIEALSRGAAAACFVEKAPAAVAALRRNLAVVKQERARLLAMPAERAVVLLAREQFAADLVLLDPPYQSELAVWALDAIVEHRLLAEGAWVVLEHSGRTAPPPAPSRLNLARSRRFGDVGLCIYRCEKG
mgnify:CR=1 FL=1